jgi:penicillin-insensitive murein endopeptidase
MLIAVRAVFVALLLAGCARLGMLEDGSSVSLGPPGRGALLDGERLPAAGEGYWVPPTWSRRGLQYGTAEMVSFVVQLGRMLGPGRRLSVADLSPEVGGPSAWHRSHQTGRDVDLLFFARNRAGRPVVADVMRRFGADGVSLPERGRAAIYFDDRANWSLVRAILENPVAEVESIFIADDLKQRLLDAAVAEAAPAELVAAAAVLLREPSRALPHDDHMHVRIYCAPSDLSLGCRDVGSLRWHKKGYKYRAESMRRRIEEGPLRSVLADRLVLVALPGLPFRGFVLR